MNFTTDQIITIIGSIAVPLVTLIIGFILGVIASYFQGWVKDYFNKKEADRNRAQRIIDEIGEITSKALNKFPKKQKIGSPHDFEGYFEKCASQLDALNQKKVASDIREFYNVWFYLVENFGDDDQEYESKELQIRDLAKKISSIRVC